MENKKIEEIREKVIRGIDLAIKKLIQSKAKVDGDLIVSVDGKVSRVKAKDLIK